MNTQEILPYIEQPCRFKLKSGKEVYGVIWEQKNKNNTEYYFSSSSMHNKIRKSAAALAQIADFAYRVVLEDVVVAEPLTN